MDDIKETTLGLSDLIQKEAFVTRKITRRKKQTFPPDEKTCVGDVIHFSKPSLLYPNVAFVINFIKILTYFLTKN